jgi:hypothetical protein
MDYTSEQLNSLIADVEKEFSAHLAKAEESFKLAKNENDQPDQKKVNGMADDKKNSAKDEKTSASENKDGGKADDSRNAAADQKQEGGDAKKEASQDKSGKPIEGEKAADMGAKDQNQQEAGAHPAQGEDHGYDDEDMQHMHGMYSSMSRGELKAHHDCIRKCMDGQGLAKCEDGVAKSETGDAAKDAEGYRPNGGPTDGEAAKAKTPASSGAQAMTKSEKDIVIEEVSLLKSELEAAKAKSEEHKKNLDAVESFLKKFVEKTAPAGKAITSLDTIAKTESARDVKPLSKSEIDAKLLAKAKDPTLAKSDRDAINSYCVSKNIERVRHLL